MILDRALAAARQAAPNNRNQDPCPTCTLGYTDDLEETA